MRSINFPTPPVHTLADLRADLPLTNEAVYFQSGSYAPIPQSTQAWMNEMLRLENAHVLGLGGKGVATEFHARAEFARQLLADFLGVAADQVVWSQNTTTATRLAVQSIRWQPGDKLALSDVEHASTFELARGMEQHHGVTTTTMRTGGESGSDADYFLEQLDRHLTADHKLLILCHVANTDGRRLPVREAAQIARARGVKTLVDGAQAVGVFPVNVGAIDADFYSGSLHKWLMGPAGLGFLLVNRRSLADFNPYWLPQNGNEVVKAATNRELGTPNYTLRLGAGYAIALLQQIGMAQIEHQMRSLSEQLRTALADRPDVWNAGPHEWERSSSITTLQLANGTPERCQRLVASLREEDKIICKFRPEICGVRISLAAFNSAEEVNLLIEALTRLLPRL